MQNPNERAILYYNWHSRISVKNSQFGLHGMRVDNHGDDGVWKENNSNSDGGGAAAAAGSGGEGGVLAAQSGLEYGGAEVI